MQPASASLASLRGISTDKRILFQIDDAAANGAAFVRQPIYGRGGYFLRRHDSACRCVLSRDVVRPIRWQSILKLVFILVGSEYPTNVKVIHTHEVVTQRIS